MQAQLTLSSAVMACGKEAPFSIFCLVFFFSCIFSLTQPFCRSIFFKSLHIRRFERLHTLVCVTHVWTWYARWTYNDISLNARTWEHRPQGSKMRNTQWNLKTETGRQIKGIELVLCIHFLVWFLDVSVCMYVGGYRVPREKNRTVSSLVLTFIFYLCIKKRRNTA